MPKPPLIPMRQHEMDAIAVWIARNRGKLTEIAGQVNPRLSPQFVQQILRRKRRSKTGQVERLLKDAGAPI